MRDTSPSNRRPARRLLATMVAVAALLGVVASSAVASTAQARVAVAALSPSAVSLLAAGFPEKAEVRFELTGPECALERTVVAEAATVRADFDAAPGCSGITVATAASETLSASTSFVFTAPPPPPAEPQPDPAPAPESEVKAAGLQPITSTCTVEAEGGQVPDAKPGDVVCFSGTLPDRLQIRQGGTEGAPITYSGRGTATVPGITVRADHVVVEGFVSKGAKDNGLYVVGDHIALRSNDISEVYIGDDDVDAIRFFGDNITIAHNYAHDIWANPSKNRRPHTDCMQTYAHSEPASSNVVIEANRCTSAQFRQCIMAEGPRDFEDGASGVGRSANWLVKGNYFECHAEAQTVALQDIHDVTFTRNDFQGTGNKAIALQKDATGATVASDNVKGSGYKRLVEIDHSSARKGYRGPGA